MLATDGADDPWLWSGSAADVFSQACCVTLVRGLSVAETFRRLGADTSTSTITGYDGLVHAAGAAHERRPDHQLAGAATLDGWTLVLEPNGYACSDPTVMGAVSAGTTTVTLYHGGDDEDELSVMDDGHRSQLLDLRARGRCVEALVERFSGVRLSAGLVHALRYRTGVLDLA